MALQNQSLCARQSPTETLKPEAVNQNHEGDCQNYGPFLGPHYNTGPNTGPNLGGGP